MKHARDRIRGHLESELDRLEVEQGEPRQAPAWSLAQLGSALGAACEAGIRARGWRGDQHRNVSHHHFRTALVRLLALVWRAIESLDTGELAVHWQEVERDAA